MTLLSSLELARCVGARDLDRLQAHLRAGGDPNARLPRPGRPTDTSGGLWANGDRLAHVTIYLGWVEGLRALLAHGADPAAPSTGTVEVRTPVGRALLVNGPWEGARHPMLATATPGSWAATQRARLACLRALLDAGAAPDQPVDGSATLHAGNAPVHLAARHRLFDAWVLLGQRGVPLDGVGLDEDGQTLLARRVSDALVRWVRHWLDAGGAVNAVLQPQEGYTALHLACRSPHPDAPKMLDVLLRQANPDLPSASGDRPLHLAMANRRHGAVMVDALLAAGANPDLAGATGLTPAQRSAAWLLDNPVHPIAHAFEQRCLALVADTARSSVRSEDGLRPMTVGRRRF